MSIAHPIPYQGSKRSLARAILRYFPEEAERLIEPFAGSAAVSLAAAYYGKAKRFFLNDANEALMALWEEIIDRPENIAAAYRKLWLAQKGRERSYYDSVRAEFNRTQRPDYFLYLLARCVKASVRYNPKGEFNQSPDNRRRGVHPDTMKAHTAGASRLLKGRTSLSSVDYREVVMQARPEDIVYMDPPYQGVCANKDRRYLNGVQLEHLVAVLNDLNRRSISFILSYDGKTGAKTFGRPLPAFLGLIQIEIDAGRSTQATLLGHNARTFESLYLSPALVSRIGEVSPPRPRRQPSQNPLFATPA